MEYYKISLLIPFCSSFAIILNVYNGDILGINNNIEYLFWFIPHLCLFTILSFKYKTLLFLSEIIILLLSIIINIYWIYAWKKDEKTNYRHRTEYYDSQAFIGVMLFVIIYNSSQNLIDKNNRNSINYKTNKINVINI